MDRCSRFILGIYFLSLCCSLYLPAVKVQPHYTKMPKVNPKNQLGEAPEQNEIPKKRKSLTAAQKKEICLKKLSTPLKQKDLAKEYNVSEGMISDILKAKDRWLVVDLNSHQATLRHEKKLPFPLVEDALIL